MAFLTICFLSMIAYKFFGYGFGITIFIGLTAGHVESILDGSYWNYVAPKSCQKPKLGEILLGFLKIKNLIFISIFAFILSF